MKRVQFLRPTFPAAEEIAADYAEILASGVFSNGGPVERRFAAAIEEWIGDDIRACLVSNCTAGLDLAIRATFRPGRSLAIVPSFTFVAGPLTLRNAGFEPVFVDVDPLTWQPQLATAESFLAERHDDVAGVLLCATFGVADARVEAWEDLARRYGVPLVIDSAAGFGSQYDSGARTGSRGTCEVFSLHATKMMGIGEGGVITSQDGELIDRLNRMKNFGFNADRHSVELGTNAKMPEFAAAVGLRQLAAMPERLQARRAVLQGYIDALAPLGVLFQPGALNSAPAVVSALMPTAAVRAAALVALVEAGIECRDYYNPPVHRQPIFDGVAPSSALPVTESLSARMLSLPMSDDLEPEVALRVAQVLAVLIAADAEQHHDAEADSDIDVTADAEYATAQWRRFAEQSLAGAVPSVPVLPSRLARS